MRFSGDEKIWITVFDLGGKAMHWSEKIAKDIIKRSPDKEEYVCAAGISPSGSIHIGNFRDIATSYFVYKALLKQGKKARLLFSWDEFDRLRKVPVNVKEIAPELEEDIGKPYVDVKDPYGCCGSYAEHFEKEFERSLARFGIEVDFRRQSENYRSGKYAKYVIQAIQKRKEIFDILEKFRALAPFPIEKLHVIGGGSKNKLLDQLTANAIGIPVVAGPSEATAIGNIMLQAWAAGCVNSLQQMRDMIAKVVETETFLPQDTTSWNEAYAKIKHLLK